MRGVVSCSHAPALHKDTIFGSSVVKRLTDLDKIMLLDEEKLASCVELDPGDRNNFLDYVQKNLHLHEYRTGRRLSLAAASAWIRRALAEALRSRNPYRVNLLLGGMDKETPSLYYLDYLASCNPVDYAAQGYCGYFAPAVLDRHWKPGLNEKEGIELMHVVIDQIKTRLVISQTRFIIKIISAQGVQVLYY